MVFSVNRETLAAAAAAAAAAAVVVVVVVVVVVAVVEVVVKYKKYLSVARPPHELTIGHRHVMSLSAFLSISRILSSDHFNCASLIHLQWQ